MTHLFNIPLSLPAKSTLEAAVQDTGFLKWVSDSITAKEERFYEEIEILLPRPMVLQVTIIFEQNDTADTAIIFATNFTEKELTARERFQLQNLESMVSLASGIAHEIGNPLNSLTIHQKLLAKAIDKLPANEKKKMMPSLRAIGDETARLDQIVRNFLKSARRKPLQFERAQINDLVSKTVSFLKPELDSAKIKVVKTLDKKMAAFLVDPERIRQVFINLIKNALHAMPKGGTLRIRTQTKEKVCLIHFQDSGVGISDEELPRIFEAYYTTKEEGSGLGLVIVYQIIREHGGRIEVASKPDAGATFSVVLPIRKEKLSLPDPRKAGAT